MVTEEAAHIIRLEALAIGHDKEQALLSGLNLSVSKGEMVALIGRNGTGKSTLLKSMIGLLDPLEGDCTLDGLALRDYSLPSRARKVSFVSSHMDQLPTLSVRELVALGRMPYTGWMGRLSQQDKEMIRHALDEVRMGSFEDRKLDCLSDGERQRAMIARALAQDTPLMVLDEPTAFLDIPNAYELIRLLSNFRDAGRSIVYSTHDLETAIKCADKMWVIHQDHILEGAPEDLGMSGLFSRLFSTSGIRYDEQAGKFLFAGTPRGNICLEGAGGEARVWTENALQRLGFVLDKRAPLKIRIDEKQDGKAWVLHRDREALTFKSLYSLARFLKQD